MTEPVLIWLGAAYGLTGPGWQGSFRITYEGVTRTLFVVLDEVQTAAIAVHLGQSKLEKRQAELILQHGGREGIEAALRDGVLSDEVRIETTDKSREDDLRRWHVGRASGG